MSEEIMAPKENPLAAFDADAIALLETRMWQAYYAKQDARLFLLLVRLVARQFGLPWGRAVRIALMLTRPAMQFARTRAEYEAVIPDIAAAYSQLQEECGASFDADEVAAREVRWWIVHRHRAEMGAAALTDAIADLYAAIYRLPPSVVREAARLRAEAAFVSDDGRERYGVRGAPYWREVGGLLRRSYRALKAAVQPA
ncbi:MAG: hypothetical protein M3Y58_03365 [Chloroflexota bacterium]|nr:hypothetical protein [Chloroflexota bacterium]